ncbi:calpain family cysteine protease [Dictyocaulus viviparus]|uniref:Calpain family cysteine protease n=1 Tax=Dictyocaulus viviparus TaxID=29172 RepID=A0A0D8YC55_DICVI|nr:calpain family cysteine protease [Dictyocaulus viviparus]
MAGWGCRYCTLLNLESNTLCSACGSQREHKGSQLLSKFVIKPISDVTNAILELFNGSPNPVSRQRTPDIIPYSESIVPASSAEQSLNWICRKCSNVNEDIATVCTQCNECKLIGSKRRRGQNRGAVWDSACSYRVASDSGDMNVTTDHRFVSSDCSSMPLCSEVMTEVERCDRESAAATYAMIVSSCREHNTSFIDDSFPHSQKSIGDISSVGGMVPSSFVWLRPEQMTTKDGRAWPWAVFRDPRSSDIEQGCLGDCWLLSAMALIAERPDILERILITKEYSHIGAYQVRKIFNAMLRLCIDGRWKIVIIDDFFPCRTRTRSIAFADGRKNQLWVPLIEKALAKQLGSYSNLLAGRTIEGLAMLTGASVEVISLEDENADNDFKWTQILSAKDAGFIMGCSCGAGKREANPEVFWRNGLLAKHAYSILDVRQEGNHRLLRLRNPWGSFVWKGNWSNNWKGWPKDLKQRLFSGEPSTGTFWIGYDDFLKHFDSVDIAKIRWFQGWTELRIPMQMGGSFTNRDKAVRFLIEEPTEVCFTLFQSGARTAHDQADLFICVHMISSSGAVGELIHRSPRKLESFVSTGDVFLKTGHYIAICHSMITLGGRKIEGCLAIHSSKPIYADMVPCAASIYTDSLVQLVLKEGLIHSSLNGVYPRYVTDNFSGLLLMVDNALDDMWVHVKAECSKSLNVVSSRAALDVADSIPPLSRQIIIILTHFEPTQSYLVHHQLTVRSSRCPSLGNLAVSGGSRFDSDTHSPRFESFSSEQLHFHKALFYP